MAHPTIGALTAGAHSSFQQTGSWSMVDIAKLPVEATIGILSRYAAGRVNPYTVLVCQTLCGQFQLTAKGRANISKAVDSLTTVGAVGSALEFGFGVEDLIRSMTKSEQGTISLAICAALREVYSLDIATEVLLEMARLSNVGGEWMPSSREWQAILNACSGVLSTTSFGTRAEVFMNFWPKEQRLGAFQRLETTPSNMRTCSSPKAVAEALSAMSAISRKDMQAVTLIGGPDIGWLAAVAEWILDFTISISDPQGETLYTNANRQDSVQIQFIFGKDAPTTTQDVALKGKTYILKQISELLGDDAVTALGKTVSGRVEWKTALKSTFLSDFKSLLSTPDTFGTLLGCAGRMYKAIAQADKSIPSMYLTACTTYCDQSHGPGFVSNTLFWFPELETLRGHMGTAVVLSLKDARRDYEACITRLRQLCACRACQSPSNGFELDNEVEMTPAPALESDERGQNDRYQADESTASSGSGDEDDWDPDKYCAVILAETVIVLSRTLANVCLDSSKLLPTRSGFELAYGRQLTMRRSARSGFSAIKELGQFAFCMDFDANFSFGMVDNDYGTGIRLDLALELFSGERPHLSNNGVSAACSNGLCAYFSILKDVSFGRSSTANIDIIPGRIQYEKKSYVTLEDREVLQDENFGESMNELFLVDSEFSILELSVRESATALMCLIQLSEDSVKPNRVVSGPANMVDFIAARRGLIRCGQSSGGRTKCRKLKDLTTEERHRLATDGGHLTKDWIKAESVYFFHCRDHLSARAVLAHCATQYLHRASIFIVDQECVDCCLKVASRTEREGRLYFLYLHN